MKTRIFRIIAGILIICLGVIFWSSPFNPWQEAPGEGNTSLIAYRELAVVIQALEKFRADRGVYPNQLTELAPQFIKSLPSMHNDRHNLRIKYTPTNGGSEFLLSFDYHGPGTNSCNYRSFTGWQCYGAY